MKNEKKEKGRPQSLSGVRRWSLIGVKRLLPFEADTWEVRCDCGTVMNLKRHQFFQKRSCGCDKAVLTKVVIYGQESLRLDTRWPPEQEDAHRIWYSLHQRCSTTKKGPLNKDYGGRGIKVCDRWKNFYLFYIDMGPRPTKGHSIEREDVSGNYEPSNCKWILKSLQSRNTRQTSRVVYKGRTVTLIEFLEQNQQFSRKDFSFVTTERKRNGKSPVEITTAVRAMCSVRKIKEPD